MRAAFARLLSTSAGKPRPPPVIGKPSAAAPPTKPAFSPKPRQIIADDLAAAAHEGGAPGEGKAVYQPATGPSMRVPSVRPPPVIRPAGSNAVDESLELTRAALEDRYQSQRRIYSSGGGDYSGAGGGGGGGGDFGNSSRYSTRRRTKGPNDFVKHRAYALFRAWNKKTTDPRMFSGPDAANLLLRATEFKLRGQKLKASLLVPPRQWTKAELRKNYFSRLKKPAELIVTGREIHFTNGFFLSRFMSQAGKIMRRPHTGLTAKQQRQMSRQVKRAQHLGLLPIMHRYMPGVDMDLPGQALRNPLAPP